MVYLDRCFNIYKDISDIRIRGPLFECDELLAPIIRELNLKGYKTVFCCSGHVCNAIYDEKEIDECSNNDNCYIAFADQINALLVKGFTLPKGFKFETPEWDVEECGYQTIIRRKFRLGAPRFTQMLNISKMLYKWVNELPNARTNINSVRQEILEELSDHA